MMNQDRAIKQMKSISNDLSQIGEVQHPGLRQESLILGNNFNLWPAGWVLSNSRWVPKKLFWDSTRVLTQTPWTSKAEKPWNLHSGSSRRFSRFKQWSRRSSERHNHIFTNLYWAHEYQLIHVRHGISPTIGDCPGKLSELMLSSAGRLEA